MPSSTDSFVDLVLRGTAAPGDIEDFIDRWHVSDSPLDLPEYLGLSADEFHAYLHDVAALDRAIAARKAAAARPKRRAS